MNLILFVICIFTVFFCIISGENGRGLVPVHVESEYQHLSNRLDTFLDKKSSIFPRFEILMQVYNNSLSKTNTNLEKLHDYFDDYYMLSVEHHRNYAQKHGYLFTFSQKRDNDPLHSHHWNKIRLLRERLRAPGPEWIWWTDVDTIIMNTNVTLESVVESVCGENKIDGGNVNINACDFMVDITINAGSFLIRRSDWSRDFVDRWWKLRDYNGVFQITELHRFFDDQDALLHIVRVEGLKTFTQTNPFRFGGGFNILNGLRRTYKHGVHAVLHLASCIIKPDVCAEEYKIFLQYSDRPNMRTLPFPLNPVGVAVGFVYENHIHNRKKTLRIQ